MVLGRITVDTLDPELKPLTRKRLRPLELSCLISNWWKEQLLLHNISMVYSNPPLYLLSLINDSNWDESRIDPILFTHLLQWMWWHNRIVDDSQKPVCSLYWYLQHNPLIIITLHSHIPKSIQTITKSFEGIQKKEIWSEFNQYTLLFIESEFL